MSRDVETLSANLPLHAAAAFLARHKVHGAPVVGNDGRCVSVLSVTDLARWVSGGGEPTVQLPRTCAFQQKHREPGGRESTRCSLAESACPWQRLRVMPDGKLALACNEPHSVPVDWQMVELESLPGDSVRDFMTTVVTADSTASVPEMSRLMLEHQVHRLIILDAERRPIGVVAVNDILQVVAHRAKG